MANVKVSALAAAAAVTAGSLLYVVSDGGDSEKATAAQVAAYVHTEALACATFAYAATVELERSAAPCHRMTDDLDGAIEITVDGVATGVSGTVDIRQDGTGSRAVDILFPDAAELEDTNDGDETDVDCPSGANADCLIAYWCVSADGRVVCKYSASPGAAGGGLPPDDDYGDVIVDDDGAEWTIDPTAALSDRQRVLRPRALSIGNTITVTTSVAYAVYLGHRRAGEVIDHVEFVLATVGTGSQVAEIGLFSSPSAPNKAGQTLTHLDSDGSLDSLLVGTGVKRNTADLDHTLAADTHLWAVFRAAHTAGTQPVIVATVMDMSQGLILVSDSSIGALTALAPSSTYAFGLSATANLTAAAPYLTAVMD